MEIYTDGSCIPNPGEGGWGFVVVVNGIRIAERSGYEPDTTNNRMELQAVIKALEWLESDSVATIYSDSLLTVKVLSRKWRGKKNTNLVEVGRNLIANKSVRLEWVRGHNGNKWNEYADQLARGRWPQYGDSQQEREPTSEERSHK